MQHFKSAHMSDLSIQTNTYHTLEILKGKNSLDHAEVLKMYINSDKCSIERAYTLSCKPQADRRWAGKGQGVTGQRGGGGVPNYPAAQAAKKV